MSDKNKFPLTWRGRKLSVDILYSRAGVAQQIIIAIDNGAILFDTGDGTLRDLINARIDRNKIKGLFYTHGHFDHMGGLHTLLGFLRMIGRKEHLCVIIPAGCDEVTATIKNFKCLYSGSIPFHIHLGEATPRDIIQIAGMSIEPFEMMHCGSVEGGVILDRIPALGYRVSCDGETVAISGDTGDCPELRQLVRDADLAIIEATYARSSDATPDELAKVHLSEELAVEIGALAKEYMLVHRGRR
jgi:ribonuclease Z